VKDERVYLLHALDAIDAIVSYMSEGRDEFSREIRRASRAARRGVIICAGTVRLLGDTFASATPATASNDLAANSSSRASPKSNRGRSGGSDIKLPSLVHRRAQHESGCRAHHAILQRPDR
jgi:hypothetical protein